MDLPNESRAVEMERPMEPRRERMEADIATIADYLSRRPLLSLGFLMEEMERQIIIGVLTKTRGNQRAASARLGIKYTTFVEKVKRHGIEIERQARLVVQ